MQALWRPSRYLQLFLVLSGLLASLAYAAQSGYLNPLDQWLLSVIHSSSNPTLDSLAKAVTMLGSWPVVLSCGAIIAIILQTHGRRREAQFTVIMLIGSWLINTALKQLFERSRPDAWVPLVRESSFSFPSGHATASAALAVVLLYLTLRTKWRRYVAVGALLYVLAIGLSRLYLGVHYPSDIVGGWLTVLAYSSLVTWLLNRRVNSRLD